MVYLYDMYSLPCQQYDFVCPGRLQPTDTLHQTTCYRYVSRLDHFLIKRCHHVSQVFTPSWGLESSPCLGLQKVRNMVYDWHYTGTHWDRIILKFGWYIGLCSHQLNHSVNFWFCFSDCDSVRFKASSYAALHRGRPPERPLNCKKPPHLGRLDLFQFSSDWCEINGSIDFKRMILWDFWLFLFHPELGPFISFTLS